jgi:hypothetical protein
VREKHLNTASRRPAANRRFGRLSPFPFVCEVHGIDDVCRTSVKAPREAIRGNSEFSVEVAAAGISPEAIGAGDIVKGDCRQGTKYDLSPGVAAVSFDQKQKTVEFVLHLFGLSKVERLAGAARDGCRTGPAADKESQLLHRFLLLDGIRVGRSLLTGKRNGATEEEDEEECNSHVRAMYH